MKRIRGFDTGEDLCKYDEESTEVNRKTLDENKLRRIALSVIDDCQQDTDKDAKREYFIYSMAYNDGVLDMLKALLRELSKEQAESEGEGENEQSQEKPRIN